MPPVSAELQGLDFGKLLEPPPQSVQDQAFKDLDERALASAVIYQAVTPEERLAAFEKLNYKPHGLYLPDGEELRRKIQQAQLTIGRIPDERVDERLRNYFALQAWTGTLEGKVPGHWTGQMGVAKSNAKFRLVQWGRRGGKSRHGAGEGLGLAISRPRSVVWVCAPTMFLVSRVFDMILLMIDDLGYETTIRRNSEQTKLVELAMNGSRIEGVSLEDYKSAPGAVVDLAIVDEAAQVGKTAFERAILPPLTDHDGRALLISSHEGDETFFAMKAEEARLEALQDGDASEWDVFHDAMYDVNFFLAPQGINSPSVLKARKEMDPEEFLEQYGAIPAGRKDRIYPTFQEKVHVGNYPYNPEHPVVLAVDPSYGANPYAVLAIQDYGDRMFIVDELYLSRFTFEELDPLLRTLPWAESVTDVVMDSASPAEVERWVQKGWPAFPVGVSVVPTPGRTGKPKVEERLPLVRYWLRDPSRFYLFHRERVNYFLAQRGMAPDSDHTLPPKELRLLMSYVEESLSGADVTAEDVQRLRGCARLFVNSACVNTIREFKLYKKEPQRRAEYNTREMPRKAHDHTMDALGYFMWHFKRFEYTGEDPGQNMVRRVAPGNLPNFAPRESTEIAGDPTPPGQLQRVNWLSNLREAYSSPSNLSPYSILTRV